jgi:arylsulfatase A-like enzyme
MGALALSLALMGCGKSPEADVAGPGTRPNVLVIVADDLGYSDLGAFGSEISTPNLDQLTKEGRVLTNFHATALCATTRAELMTGVDHHLVGMGTLPELSSNYSADDAYAGSLNNHAPTIAQLLRDAGYHTYMAGKWHLAGGGPPALGFEQSFSLNYSSAEASNFAPGAGNSSSTSEPYFENGVQATIPADFYSSDYFVDKLKQYIAKDHGDRKPFFAYLAFQATHFPLQAPDAYLDRYTGVYDVGYANIRAARLQKQKALGIVPQDFVANAGDEVLMTRFGSPGMLVNTSWDLLSASDKASEARIMEVFAGMLTNLDDNVGRVVAYLKQIGEYDNTFILFVSDNGADGVGTQPLGTPTTSTDLNNALANYGRPGSFIFRSARWAEVGTVPFRLFKAFPAEGGLSVPAIARLPFGKGQGSSGAVSSLLDVVPTILSMASVATPGSEYQGQPIALLEGASLLPVLYGLRSEVHDDSEVLVDEVNDLRYVRRGPWKMTRFVNYLIPPAALLMNHDWQLFNMDSDRGETTDVAAAHPDIVAELTDEWRAYVTRVGVQQPLLPPLLTPIDQ